MSRAKRTARTSPPPAIGPASARWRISYVVIAIAFVCYVYPQHSWKQYRNVNEQARLYLLKAVVEEGVLNIDTGIKNYGNVQDRAMRDGHSYCDKPVGLSATAVPIYAVLHSVGRFFGYDWTIQRMRFALTIFCVTLPTVLLLFLLDRYWKSLGAPEWLVGLGLLAYGLGSIAFTYSTQFVGHQLAAVLAFAHFFLSRRFVGRVHWTKLLLAGTLAGLGAITDYFSAFIHLAIIMSYITRIRPLTAWVPFLAGGILAFSPLPLYNLLAFGAVTKMSYQQEALPVFQTQHGTGFFGVTFPRPESIFGLLISPTQGLFFFSPFLLLGIVGVIQLVRNRETKREGIVIAFSIVIVAWLALSVLNWRAGWTVGPRHMVSMLPFLVTGVVEAVRRNARLIGSFIVTVLLSMFLVFVPTMTLPAFDVNFAHPFTSQALFLVRQGLVSPNLGHMIGLSGSWSLLIPAVLILTGITCVLLHMFKSGVRIDFVSVALPVMALAIGGWLLSGRNRPTESEEMYYQARTLKLVDRPQLAGFWFEHAVEHSADPNVRRKVADRAYPEAVAIYGPLSDFASLHRIAERWASIDPESPKLRELREVLTSKDIQ